MNIYTIPYGYAFLKELAKGVLRQSAEQNIALHDFTILLPNRRSCRTIRDIFLDQSGGKPLLLPRLQPIGDLDEETLSLETTELDLNLPQPINAVERQLLLASRIEGWHQARGIDLPKIQALHLAEQLAGLLDELHRERVDASKLQNIVPDLFAAHFQEVLSFLDIIRKEWPQLLSGLKRVDPGEYRNALLLQQIKNWEKAPPQHPIIAAGSTASVAASAEMLRALAKLPMGCVILPAFDRGIGIDDGDAIDETHPQHSMRQFVQFCGLSPQAVNIWPWIENVVPETAKAALWREVMRPAATTHKWANARIAPGAVDGINLLSARTTEEEAEIIALIMREALEQPGKTVALITPDRGLARRVAAEMRQWNVEVDDSGGTPLSQLPVGNFLMLACEFTARGCGVADALSLLKHSLAALGFSAAECRHLTRRIEWKLRQRDDVVLRLQDGINALPQELDALDDQEKILLARLSGACAKFAESFANGAAAVIEAHVALAEKLAATDTQPGGERLWKEKDGEAAAGLFRQLLQYQHYFNIAAPDEYAALFGYYLQNTAVRTSFDKHPRLKIWGLLEARLQGADRVILGGMNEGSWPDLPEADPWLNRPMRKAIGLPSPEKRIGQSSHDFVQATAAPEIYLTRANRAEGQPTVPSRLWMRLLTLLNPSGLQDKVSKAGQEWKNILSQHQEAAAQDPFRQPKAMPPLAARPRKFSPTQIETLIRDPYGFYAKYILHLRALSPLSGKIEPNFFGNVMHDILDVFVKKYPSELPPDALPELVEIGRKAFLKFAHHPMVEAFLWPQFERLAEWFVALETARRKDLSSVKAEEYGEIRIDVGGIEYTLSARADRIEIAKDGSIHIVDYKTGKAPSDGDVEQGSHPQLAVEGAIMREGGFKSAGTKIPETLEFWRLPASGDEFKAAPVGGDIKELIESAWQGVLNLLKHYADESQPYIAEPIFTLAPKYTDYRHLSRHAEWTEGGGKK